MLAAILAMLGISPIIILILVLVFLIYRRYQFKKKSGVFPVKLRIEEGSFPGVGKKWPRSTSLAHWVHDVLLVNTYLPLESTHPYPVDRVDTNAKSAQPLELRGLGDHQALHRLYLDDGTIFQMAVPSDFDVLAQGPFTESEPAT